MAGKRHRPKVRKHLGKKNPKVDVVDEWETMDVDRDEQKAGIERRRKRWRQVETERLLEKAAEQAAIKHAEKMNPDRGREPNFLEKAWLRCDYVLSNVMEKNAYNFLENIRVKDPECYKRLYKIFMSKNMMSRIQAFVDFFAQGGEVPERIPLSEVVKHYRKIKGIRSKIKVVHKGEDDRDL